MGTKIVRLNLSEEEYSDAINKSIENGFANVPDFVRFLLFNKADNSVNYDNLIFEFEKQVEKLQHETRFRIKDLFPKELWGEIPTQARKNLGRMIFRKVMNGNWIPIQSDGKDSANAQWYIKIKK
ncbi:hypothetical protein ASG65_19100 [Bacillus sp. Leaf13]|nr:hypothetical protein ASG65_19100 [Bacillus sp. Leaf13]